MFIHVLNTLIHTYRHSLLPLFIRKEESESMRYAESTKDLTTAKDTTKDTKPTTDDAVDATAKETKTIDEGKSVMPE